MKNLKKDLLKKATISFIGGGRMCQALLEGLKNLKVKEIKVSEPLFENHKKIKKLFPKVQVFKDNSKVLETSILILAVKPQVIKEVAKQIKKNLSNNVLIISIAAGVSINQLKKFFPFNSIIRVMPNSPARIQHGISALCFSKGTDDFQKKLAEKIFSSVGKTFWISEKFMDLITAISGSGPAFFYYFVEALIEAGAKHGLSPKTAKELAVTTGLGALKMLDLTGKQPQELINEVASPGGTTLAGLEVLQKAGFKKIIEETIKKATLRAKYLSSLIK